MSERNGCNDYMAVCPETSAFRRYHYGYDLNGNRASVTVTVPVVVTVLDTNGAPQSGLAVYAFNGTTYTGYSKTTDSSGQATFTLPQGDYRFRADRSGQQYFSDTANHCSLPGCTAVTITLPAVGGFHTGGVLAKPALNITPLQLRPLCSPNPDRLLAWEVRNANPFPVRVEWEVISNQLLVIEAHDSPRSEAEWGSGTVTVPAAVGGRDGIGFIVTEAAPGADTLQLATGAFVHATARASDAVCNLTLDELASLPQTNEQWATWSLAQGGAAFALSVLTVY